MGQLLYKLREWLTAADAAKHLSLAFEEALTEADVLRLGLDGHLTLSVIFVNLARGREGRIVSTSPDPDAENRPVLGTGDPPLEYPPDYDLPGEGVFLCNEPDTIRGFSGIWDLPMKGSERYAVEGRYLSLTGGPRMNTSAAAGAFAKQDGVWCQLFDEEFDERGRPVLLASRGLPKDALIVVRTKALDDFKMRLSQSLTHTGEPSSMDKPLVERERLSLLRIIRAVANEGNVDISQPAKAGESISMTTETLGVRVAPRTVAAHLKKIKEELS